MKTLNEKFTSKGRALANCNICGKSLIGESFFSQLINNKLSFFQKNQMKLLLKTAGAGAKILEMEIDKSPKSLVGMIITRHYSSKALKRNSEHKKVLDEMINSLKDYEVIKKYASFSKELLNYLESS